jgi:predicted nucleotidyltransferase
VDISAYVRTLRARDRALALERTERAARLQARLPELARLLAGLGARRVLVFGSLLHGEVHAGSDIDLAVEGLAAERYWAALDAVTRAAGVPVDLVPLEDAAPSLRERVLAEGQVLYG